MQRHITKFGSLWIVISLILLTVDFAWGLGNWGSSARATGMGNAFVAMKNDPSAVFYNPAGLADIRTWTFHVHYARESKYGVGQNESPFLVSSALVIPLGEYISIGLSGLKKDSWADRTSLVSSNVGSLCFSVRVNPKLAIGISAKSIQNSNYGNGKGVDLDLGFLFQPLSRLRLGLAVENLLATEINSDAMTPQTTGYKTIRATRAGLLYRLEKLQSNLTFDLILKETGKNLKAASLQPAAGIEKQVLEAGRMQGFLRAGYTMGSESGRKVRQPGAGWGIRYKGTRSIWQIDYSWQSYPYKSTERSVGDHRISVTIYPKLLRSQTGESSEKEITWAGKVQKDHSSHQDAFQSNQQYKLGRGIHTEHTFVGENEFLIFLVELDTDVHVAEWRLDIYADQGKDGHLNRMKHSPLWTLRGWTMPASTVLWDLRVNGNKISGGTYYYCIEVFDAQATSWRSELKTFHVR